MLDLRVLHVRSGRDHHPERIDEVVNLWKPSYLVDKSVTDLDWGANGTRTTCGAPQILTAFSESSNKLFSATPSGNFLIFDVPKGRLGESTSFPAQALPDCHVDREIRGGHSRPINVVRACKTQGHSSIIITGGTEGQARIFVSPAEIRCLATGSNLDTDTCLGYSSQRSQHKEAL